MSALRILVRAPLFALWTSGLWFLWFLGLPLAVPAGRRLGWRRFILGTWGRGGCRLLGVRLTVRGPVPEGAVLLVSNHLSYLDVLVLAGRLGCAFVSKAEVAGWPVLGRMARSMGTLFVDRERKRSLAPLVAEMRARLEAGETLVVFPEGTSTRGAEVLPFRPSLLEPAAALGIAVHAVALGYSTPEDAPPAWKAVAWWGDRTFLPHFLGLCGLARIEARLAFGEDPVRSSERKELARRLEQAVRERFEPLVSSAEEPRGVLRPLPLPPHSVNPTR